MKKLLLSLMILGAGAATFARLTLVVSQSHASAARDNLESRDLGARMKELGTSVAEFRAQIQAKRTRLSELSARNATAPGPAETPPGDSSEDERRLTPAQLRQRLGIRWDNSPAFVLVSKRALKEMYLRGIDDKGAFTPTACAILGLTSAERDTVEAALKRAASEHADWAKTAVQRIEPAGDIVADYRLPANPDLGERIETEGEALLKETLGPDRAGLVRQYAGTWIFTHGNLGQTPVRFTVHRHPDGRQPPLWSICEAGGTSGSSDVSPGSFPDLFRGVFPGGWRDLAQREGFALPEGFE